MPSNQVAGPPVQKRSKWRFFFIFLGVLQAAGVGLFFFVMMWAVAQAKSGVSGTEFIALILFMTLVPAVGVVALINLIGLPIYMIKRKPHGMGLILCIISLIISLILALYGAYTVYQMQVAVPQQSREAEANMEKESKARDQQFANDNAKPEITKAEAIELINSCQIKGFYYTDQTDKENGGWGELSTTGVVLTKVDGKPYRISIADKLVPELVPIARTAQKNCTDLQFWHNGHYEQRQADGSWR
jgi:Tfp pilus assembly protein PilE